MIESCGARARHQLPGRPGGADLAGIIGGLATWGERWLEEPQNSPTPASRCGRGARSNGSDRRCCTAWSSIFPEGGWNRRYSRSIRRRGCAELCHSDPAGNRTSSWRRTHGHRTPGGPQLADEVRRATSNARAAWLRPSSARWNVISELARGDGEAPRQRTPNGTPRALAAAVGLVVDQR